jgi:hypothetical protein
MNRFILPLAFLFAGVHCSTGQNFYFKSETNIEGGLAILSSMVKSSMTFYQKDNQIKTVTTMFKNTQEVICDENKLAITNERAPKCAIFTRAQLLLDSLENDMNTTDVRVEKTTETEKLLGYNCLKTIIRYKIDGYEYQGNFWCTKEITAPKPDVKPLEYTKRNALFIATQELDGFPLKTETIMFSTNMKTITLVTEVNTKDIDYSVFALAGNRCKKPYNLEEYKAELLRQKRDFKNFQSFSGGSGW